jgi:hypothetical protein
MLSVSQRWARHVVQVMYSVAQTFLDQQDITALAVATYGAMNCRWRLLFKNELGCMTGQRRYREKE